MKREDRAKQFLSFDAMKGLAEALRRQEELAERVERIEPGEDDAAAISATLCRLARGDEANVTFFKQGHYLTRHGRVTALDEAKRLLCLEGERIPFDTIRSVEVCKLENQSEMIKKKTNH